ncbi:unnamed protein product, partial [Ectocarpus fasciculatus]
GRTRFSDALVIALTQACKGGEKRWYASTLELQRTSLDICRACRSTSIVHVRVDHQTPRSLWSPRKVQSRPNTRSSKARISSRVPVVRALRLPWALSMKSLLRRAAIELWTWSEYLELQGSLCVPNLGLIDWPRGLTQLVLDTEDGPIDDMSLPVHLQRLALGGGFNQAIGDVMWPASLQKVSFGLTFNQPIAEVVWPASLQQISFGKHFNQAIGDVVWPTSLQQLSFGEYFNQAIGEVLWPASLQNLSFGSAFKKPITGVVWPVSLRQLSFGDAFNQQITGVVWPASLR